MFIHEFVLPDKQSFRVTYPDKRVTLADLPGSKPLTSFVPHKFYVQAVFTTSLFPFSGLACTRLLPDAHRIFLNRPPRQLESGVVEADVNLVLIGAGGHASDVLGAIEALGEGAVTRPRIRVGAVVDPEFESDVERLSQRYEVQNRGTLDAPNELSVDYLIAVGYPQDRRSVHARISHLPNSPATIIHPSADLSRHTTVGGGSVILSGARLSPNVSLGAHCSVSQLASIGHDVVVEDFTSIFPGAVISGGVSIGQAALLGANCTILENVHVGNAAAIAAGAVVARDIPDGTTVMGVPAPPSLSALPASSVVRGKRRFSPQGRP